MKESVWTRSSVPLTATEAAALTAALYATAGEVHGPIDAYNDCWLTMVHGTTEAEWNTYCAALCDKGYELVVKTAISNTENTNAIYTNGKALINCLYDVNNRRAVLTAEPCDVELSVFHQSERTESVREPKLIQVGLDINEDVEAKDTERSGMGYIFCLSDGRFVIYDGGFAYKSTVRNADRLYNVMKKNLPASGRYAGQMVIASWVITHPHIDHIGALIDFVSRYLDIEDAPVIESVICNLPSCASCAEENDTSIVCFGADVTVEKVEKYNKLLTALEEKGTSVYKAHTGQTYYFNEMAIEILFAPELYYPTYNVGRDKTGNPKTNAMGTNALSIVSSMTWDTVAGRYAFMITGDAAPQAIGQVNSLCGDTLKKVRMNEDGTPAGYDFVQTPHHGCVSDYKEEADRLTLTAFYESVSAYRTLIPAGIRWGNINIGTVTVPNEEYKDDARLMGYVVRSYNPTPVMYRNAPERVYIAGSRVIEFTLHTDRREISETVTSHTDYYAAEPSLESTAAPLKETV